MKTFREYVVEQVYKSRNEGWATPYDEDSAAEDLLSMFVEQDEINFTDDELKYLETSLKKFASSYVEEAEELYDADVRLFESNYERKAERMMNEYGW